jgi:hypothetical protein
MDARNDHPRDLTILCERVSRRLAAEEARYPAAAAVALAVRGLHGVDPTTFADQFGIDPDHLARVESGAVSFDQLPPVILRLASAEPRLDVDRLRVAADRGNRGRRPIPSWAEAPITPLRRPARGPRRPGTASGGSS